MSEARIIVAGTSEFADWRLLDHTLNRLIGKGRPRRELLFVCGRGGNADKMGEKWARKSGYRVIAFPAQWKHPDTGMYDPDAGFKRNTQMAEFAAQCAHPRLVAFWNGITNGTRDMIAKATEEFGAANVRVIRY